MNKSFIALAAKEQAEAIYTPHEETVIASYAALIAYHRDLFHCCPIDAIETSKPFYYKNVDEMFAAIERNDYHVWNADTFPQGHPYAEKDYGIWRQQKHFITSRIVHDYFGHYKHRVGFGTANELRLAAIVAKDLPDAAKAAHVCEFVTQICFFEVYGTYPEQKAFMPSETLMAQWSEIVKLKGDT